MINKSGENRIYKYRLEFPMPANKAWGRFGGGWQWKLGFQAGGKTVIFNLLVGKLKITRKF